MDYKQELITTIHDFDCNNKICIVTKKESPSDGGFFITSPDPGIIKEIAGFGIFNLNSCGGIRRAATLNEDQIMVVRIIYLVFIIPGDIAGIQSQGLALKSHQKTAVIMLDVAATVIIR